ncbi:MAG: hypothetical protein RBU25_16130 [Lentisphaeria bacterium]|jgi:hypothetical protein|nr:hypothetical protein [Lentisphaeria bacterium]
MNRWALVVGGLLALATVSAGPRLESLDLMQDEWPRAFFFRVAEGMSANPRVAYEGWDSQMGRLQGIMGKCLDEEIPGRSLRNVPNFTQFKADHPRQAVLLHYNGNARDPRDGTAGFFAGHWIYYNGTTLAADVPAVSGECDLPVADPSLFRTSMGRYQDKNEDIGLCLLDAEGRPDWSRAEQVELLAVDLERKVLRVRRGCFGTAPMELPAGRAYVAAHMTEGPWGARNNLLWFYNYSTRSPRDGQGRQCAEVLLADLAGEFGPEGRLAAFDGLEFDVLSHQHLGRGKRGPDMDADGKPDGGMFEGVNTYGVGVWQFLAGLRLRLGEDRLLLADGHGPNHQRGFGLLNGIESEGWPTLNDFAVEDWSGGLNRHAFWRRNGRAPVFNYVNHKFLDGGEGQLPDIPFSRHRLVLAAALFTDSAVCYSFAPPAVKGEPYPVWDELWQGTERKVAWLGKPLGPARHLAAEQPNLLPDLANVELVGTNCEVSREGGVLRVGGQGENLAFTLSGVLCSGPDLLVTVGLRGESLPGYPETMPRLAWCGISPDAGWLVRPELPPVVGMCLRGGEERALDPESGATVRYFREREVGGESRESYLCHPPWRGGAGYTFWEREVLLPERAVLRFGMGMGPLSPERSDGVVFRVLAKAGDEAWQEVFTENYVAFAWADREVDLNAWSGKRTTLRFVTDCGPKDDSTTDHAAWADVRVASAGQSEQRTPASRHMTWVSRETFTSTFAFRRVATPTVDLVFEVEGGQTVWIESLTAHAGPEVVWREYENGLVVANASLHPVRVPLADLVPGGRFRRLPGSASQDPATNNGQPVGEFLELGERDGLFLVRVAE